MSVDPYFITQDNGAGAPIHFAVTYCQLDMVSAAMTTCVTWHPQPGLEWAVGSSDAHASSADRESCRSGRAPCAAASCMDCIYGRYNNSDLLLAPHSNSCMLHSLLVTAETLLAP